MLKRTISFSMVVGQIIMVAGALGIIFVAPYLLELIKSQTMLPSRLICVIYLVVVALELNHSECASVISTDNRVPYVVPSLVSGGVIVAMTFVVLRFTTLGLLGVVLVQGIVQAAYNNWRWPLWVFRELDMSVGEFYRTGIVSLYQSVSSLWKSMLKRA